MVPWRPGPRGRVAGVLIAAAFGACGVVSRWPSQA